MRTQIWDLCEQICSFSIKDFIQGDWPQVEKLEGSDRGGLGLGQFEVKKLQKQ